MNVYCENCGKIIKNAQDRCSYCGHKIEILKDEPAPVKTSKSALCILSFVFSFLGWVPTLLLYRSAYRTLNIILPALSIIFAVVGMTRAKRLNQRYYYLGLAGAIISVHMLAFIAILLYAII